MSEALELYTIDGQLVIMYSPKVALELVDAGKLFIVAPPVDGVPVTEMFDALDEEE